MKKMQTAEQAAARANQFFGDRCITRVTDYGTKVTFEPPQFMPIDAVGEEFTELERFEGLLRILDDRMRRALALKAV